MLQWSCPDTSKKSHKAISLQMYPAILIVIVDASVFIVIIALVKTFVKVGN